MIRKVLFVIEKYCDGRAQLGLSYGSSMLKDTLDSSGLVQEIDQFFFDERVIQAGRDAMEEDLLQKCRRMKPDLVVYTPNRDEISPRRSTLRKLTRELKLRTVVHLGDVCHNPWMIEEWLSYVSYVVIIGGDQIHDLYYKHRSRVVNSFSAASPYVYRDSGIPRDIDVSFLGSRAVHPNRVEFIDHLIKNGIQVVSSGGQRENPMILEDYARTLNRSKLTVNFCLNGYDNIQVKGRLWEAMSCGAVVLEQRNEFTPRYFKDGRDLVLFETKAELLSKVQELLSNDGLRDRISRAGHATATSRFGGRQKWTEIISHIEANEAAGGEAGLGSRITRLLKNVSRKCRVKYYCLSQPVVPHPYWMRPALVKKGLVSIMMPVMNGELFLAQALESLLAQDYPDFELTILDNMSTDRTPAICREFAKRDPRVRYVPDDTNRITHDAANHLAGFIAGEYCMVACDDDLWAPNFLSRLVGCLADNQDIGLVYSNGLYVDVNDRVGDKPFLSGRQIYRSRHSCFSNFWNYLGTRRVVPVLFGVYRSETYMRALPFDTFDETIADVDNLFMLKVLAETKVHCINENLFFYRNKFRWADPDLLPSYPKDRNLIKVWFYDFRHQAMFTRKILDVIRSSGFTRTQRMILKIRLLQCLLLHMTWRRFRSWMGGFLIKLGLRHGVTQNRDASAEIRHHALLEKTGTLKKTLP